MNTVTSRGREVRPAAKVILYDEDRNLVIVESAKSGIYNLPGGGIDPRESPVEAALRELEEEIGLKESNLANLALRTTVSGLVPLGRREMMLHWTVFEAGLTVPVSEIVIPDESEIKNVHCLEPSAFAAHDRKSDLAHQALIKTGYLDA
jgi:8-oxo-dGTP pyrophosphatase MutT (NUDIX family)